jgi:hypothetical protein
LQDCENLEARELKICVLVDSFWSNIENIVKDLKPFYTVTRKVLLWGYFLSFMLKVGTSFWQLLASW